MPFNLGPRRTSSTSWCWPAITGTLLPYPEALERERPLCLNSESDRGSPSPKTDTLLPPGIEHPHQGSAFLLYTDASEVGLGSVSAQETPEWEWLIFSLRQKLTQVERKYEAIEREALAVKWAMEGFRYYLLGQKFTMVTDHAQLQ